MTVESGEVGDWQLPDRCLQQNRSSNLASNIKILLQCQQVVVSGEYSRLSRGRPGFDPRQRPDGIEALCSDLGVDDTDVRILMLAWKLKAAKQGFFSKDECRTGMKALGFDSLKRHFLSWRSRNFVTCTCCNSYCFLVKL